MSSEKNEAVVQRFEEEFKNKANLDVVDEVCAKDFTHAAFPHEQLKLVVEQYLVDGDLVVTRDRVRAVHKGTFNGIPATGKEVGWTENNIYRLKEGKIVELWGEGNFLGLMFQLGAVPPAK